MNKTALTGADARPNESLHGSMRLTTSRFSATSRVCQYTMQC